MRVEGLGRSDWLDIARCALERGDTEAVQTALRMAMRLRGRRMPQIVDTVRWAEEKGDPATILRNMIARRGSPLQADRVVGRWNPYNWMFRR